jgi:hypothetical protein
MKLAKDYRNRLVVIDKNNNENTIHVDHTNGNIEDIKEDSYDAFLVVEECTNFGRLHLILDRNEDEAAQNVHDYLFEESAMQGDTDFDFHLIGVFKLEM